MALKLRSFLFFLVAMLAFTIAQAQDKIYKRNGDVLDVKVKEVSAKTVTYRRTDMADGPDYTINKSEIRRIVYSNGVEDVFDRRGEVHTDEPETKKKTAKLNYGANILALSPVSVTDHGVGVGLSYERALDKKGMFSFYLPLVYSFNSLSNEYNPTTGNYDNENTHMFYAYPGVRIYPTGQYGVVRYGIGPQLAIGSGNKYQTVSIYDTSGIYSHTERRLQDRFRFGVMVNNSLNINPNPHLYLGLEFALGLTYINRIDDKNASTDPLVNLSFKVGYRF